MLTIKTSFLIPFTLLSCKSTFEVTTGQIQMDTIIVYSDFEERGYTTASAYTHFDSMKQEGVTQINVTDKDRVMIELILTNAEKNKHYQTKFGTQNIFCEVKFANQYHSDYSRVIMSIGTEKVMITDLTAMKNYMVTDPTNLEWLLTFSERVKNQKENGTR